MEPAKKDADKSLKDIIVQAEVQIRSGNLRKGMLSLAELCIKNPDSSEALEINKKYEHIKAYQDAISFYKQYNRIS